MNITKRKIKRSTTRKPNNYILIEDFDINGNTTNLEIYKIEEDGTKTVKSISKYQYIPNTNLLFREDTVKGNVIDIREYKYDIKNRLLCVFRKRIKDDIVIGDDCYEVYSYIDDNHYTIENCYDYSMSEIFTDKNGNITDIFTDGVYYTEERYKYDNKNRVIAEFYYKCNSSSSAEITLYEYDEYTGNIVKETHIFKELTPFLYPRKRRDLDWSHINGKKLVYEFKFKTNSYGDTIYREYFDDVFGCQNETIEYEYYEEETKMES